MNKFLFCLSLFLLTGCDEEKKESPTVFFAGEIVNPTSEYVVLYRGDEVLDSALLDESNRFSFKLDSIREGLHHFYHHPELQYIYLEEGDSLQMRLNTLEFDESLVFSGTGEEVNNFLLEMFLVNENEEEFIYSLYGLEPEPFVAKTDSLRTAKIEALDALAKDSELSQGAYQAAKAGIVYKSYIAKEAYPFYHKKKKGEKRFHNLPENFYSYRSEIDFEDEALTYLRPYYNFMIYHMGNLAYMTCKKDCGDGLDLASNQLHYNRHKLKLTDSLVKQSELRDNLFRHFAIKYLLKPDCEENIQDFIDEFKSLSGSNKHMEEITNLYEGIKRIQPDKELPDLMVYNTEDEKVSIREIAKDKNAVFYFWSGSEVEHFKHITKRIQKLKKKHPEYTFIGINMRTDQQRWKSIIEINNLKKSEQFWTENFEEAAHTLIVYDANKSIIAKNGIIVDAFANVYSSF
ncbi:MAG: TlpA family protein disulfide reductase [Flavobacteriaceae bacterium]